MFSITKREFYKNPSALLNDFDGDTEVWELCSTRVIVLGDGADLDEDDQADAVLLGTLDQVIEAE